MKRAILILLLCLGLSGSLFGQAWRNGVIIMPDTSISGQLGGIYFSLSDSLYYTYTGTKWQSLAAGGDAEFESVTASYILADSIHIYLLRVFNVSDTTYTVVYDTAGSDISQGYIVTNCQTGVMKDTLLVSSNELIPALCWYSNEGTLQRGEVIFFWATPSGFPGFDAESADSAIVLPIMTKTATAADNKVDLYAYDSSDSTSSDSKLANKSAVAWTAVDVAMKGDRAVLATIGNLTILAIKAKLYAKSGNRAIVRNFTRHNW